MSNPVYCVGRLPDGTCVHLELTNEQVFGEDVNAATRVAAFEDRQGELVMHEVTLGELSELGPEPAPAPPPRRGRLLR